MGGADQRDVALAGLDPRQRDPRRIDRGGFLAHEGARRAAHAMHDGDVAGEQVGELRQEQRRPQIVHQPFVEKARMRIAPGVGVQDRCVDREVALAAAGGDDHVHPAEDFLVALDAGRIQRQPGGIGADALPGFHLALVALFRNLGVERDRGERMHDVGREALVVDVDLPGVQRFPMRIQPLAERGDDADAGDPDFLRARGLLLSHALSPAVGSRSLSAIASMCTRMDGSGKGARPKVSSALHFNSLPTRPLTLVTA